MKKLFLLTLIISSSIWPLAKVNGLLQAVGHATVCHAASDKKFVMSHPKPLPFHFQSSIGKAITYPTPDGRTADAYELKAKTPTNNYILVVHEYFGLNDYVKKESEDIYNDLGNVNIIDLDLYDGKSSADRAEAAKLMQAVTDTRADAIIKGAIAYVGPKASYCHFGLVLWRWLEPAGKFISRQTGCSLCNVLRHAREGCEQTKNPAHRRTG